MAHNVMSSATRGKPYARNLCLEEAPGLVYSRTVDEAKCAKLKRRKIAILLAAANRDGRWIQPLEHQQRNREPAAHEEQVNCRVEEGPAESWHVQCSGSVACRYLNAIWR